MGWKTKKYWISILCLDSSHWVSDKPNFFSFKLRFCVWLALSRLDYMRVYGGVWFDSTLWHIWISWTWSYFDGYIPNQEVNFAIFTKFREASIWPYQNVTTKNQASPIKNKKIIKFIDVFVFLRRQRFYGLLFIIIICFIVH